MGILVNAEDQQALNEGVALAVSSQSAGITNNARAYAAEHLAISGVMGPFRSNCR